MRVGQLAVRSIADPMLHVIAALAAQREEVESGHCFLALSHFRDSGCPYRQTDPSTLLLIIAAMRLVDISSVNNEAVWRENLAVVNLNKENGTAAWQHLEMLMRLIGRCPAT